MNISASHGFANPSIDAAFSFRALLSTMSRPGKLVPLTVAFQAIDNLNPVAKLVALTLVDQQSPIWLDEDLNSDQVQQFIKFNCAATISAAKNQAMFGFFSHCPSVKELEGFQIGTAEYPDRSTTIIIQVTHLSHEDVADSVTLQGPGIKTTQVLYVKGLHDDFWQWFQTNQANFPLGNDIILAGPTCFAALSRSTKIIRET